MIDAVFSPAGKVALATVAVAGVSVAGVLIYKSLPGPADPVIDPETLQFDDPGERTELDEQIATLSQQHAPLAVQLLSELIRLPESNLATDPHCGESNHESPRLEYLKQQIEHLGAVLDPRDIVIDDFGTLIWHVTDPEDTLPLNDRRVIYLDSHLDTYPACRSEWIQQLGGGIEPFQGLLNPTTVNDDHLTSELKFIPPKNQWDNLIFGRGSVSSLQGIVTQLFATKILLETRESGSLRGVQVYCIAGLASQANAGASGLHIMSTKRLPTPDCVILTAATGHVSKSPCGLYIGEAGRCQIQLTVAGEQNAMEYGALIVAEAAEAAKAGFGSDSFLGDGSRTAVRLEVETITNFVAPRRFVARFDRRLSRGENAEMAVQELEGLRAVARARDAGFEVVISVPMYREKSYRGVSLDNPQEYLSWSTPPRSRAVEAAVEAYKRTVSPRVQEPAAVDDLPRTPRLGRWIGGTDGAGYLVRRGGGVGAGRDWVEDGEFCHPPMFGIGAGFEQHATKVGEYVHKNHLWCPIAVVARFPSVFRARTNPQAE
jgi:acetylornithine deacetylase/succinyl-diaminopimelate desuccinylase-like protein